MTDYRFVIAHVLAQRPFDEETVHDCVCTYVRAERDDGRSASDVIVALSELVERPGGASAAVRHRLTRRVIPWCVEAYFGVPTSADAERPERSHSLVNGNGKASPQSRPAERVRLPRRAELPPGASLAWGARQGKV